MSNVDIVIGEKTQGATMLEMGRYGVSKNEAVAIDME